MYSLRKLLWPILTLMVTFGLTGCLETEAKLTWHEDGSMDLQIALSGDLLETGSEMVIEQLREGGFNKIKLTDGRLSAEERFKDAGWDRWSGWLPGRFSYQDPSGLTFSRVSRVIFEDFELAGILDIGRLVELPIFVGAMGLPFVFEVEAPWPALFNNADEVNNKTYIWKKTLGRPFEVELVYRRWYPERVVVVLLLVVLLSLVLWRKLLPRLRV